MKRLLLFSIMIFSGLIMHAQSRSTEDVELVESDGTSAIFQVVGIASNRGETLRSAEISLFHTLFYEGVEGINSDNKLVDNITKKNIFYLEKFSEGKNAPMNRFISGVELLGDKEKNDTGDYSAQYMLIVKYKALLKDLELSNLRHSE